MQELEKKFKEVNQLIHVINSFTEKITNQQVRFFDSVSVGVKFKDPEHCFNTMISWLYVLFIEVGSKNVDFIKKKFVSYKISISDDANNIVKIVNCFRTIFQHNLSNSSRSDVEKKNNCEFWFQNRINKTWPQTIDDWKNSVEYLLSEVSEFLSAINLCLIEINKREHKDLIFKEWKRIKERNHTVFEFEKVLNEVLNNHDLSAFFDSNQLTKKYINEWRKDLDILPDGFDFEESAYPIVERFILNRGIIPIDGRDLIEIGVEPGARISELLEYSKKSFKDNPCNKRELLDRVKKIL